MDPCPNCTSCQRLAAPCPGPCNADGPTNDRPSVTLPAPWRVFRVELLGEVGWYDDGKVTLRPGESRAAERARIEACENVRCRLVPIP